MIRIDATNDKVLLDTLSDKIFKNKYNKDVGYVLYYDSTPIGLASICVDIENSILEKIGILYEKQKNGFGDFFTRSLMLRLSDVSEKITIKYNADYFLQFGFTTNKDQTMSVDSENIIFPKKCQD